MPLLSEARQQALDPAFFDIRLSHDSVWLVSAVEDKKAVWVSVGEDGSIETYKKEEDNHRNELHHEST